MKQVKLSESSKPTELIGQLKDMRSRLRRAGQAERVEKLDDLWSNLEEAMNDADEYGKTELTKTSRQIRTFLVKMEELMNKLEQKDEGEQLKESTGQYPVSDLVSMFDKAVKDKTAVLKRDGTRQADLDKIKQAADKFEEGLTLFLASVDDDKKEAAWKRLEGIHQVVNNISTETRKARRDSEDKLNLARYRRDNKNVKF